jgi:hypothetical protein
MFSSIACLKCAKMNLACVLFMSIPEHSAAQEGPTEIPCAARAPVEYFVSPTGRPTNSGSEAMPWPSVAFAFNYIKGGDIITLLPGTYSEPLIVERSGTAENPTVIRSQRKWEAILKESR